MNFTYSAFTENSPEMREWLSYIGYTISMVTMDEGAYIKTQANGRL